MKLTINFLMQVIFELRHDKYLKKRKKKQSSQDAAVKLGEVT